MKQERTESWGRDIEKEGARNTAATTKRQLTIAQEHLFGSPKREDMTGKHREESLSHMRRLLELKDHGLELKRGNYEQSTKGQARETWFGNSFNRF